MVSQTIPKHAIGAQFSEQEQEQIRKDIAQGGTTQARALEKVANYINNRFESIDVHLNYTTERTVGVNGDDIVETDFTSIESIILQHKSFKHLYDDSMYLIERIFGLTGRGEYNGMYFHYKLFPK